MFGCQCEVASYLYFCRFCYFQFACTCNHNCTSSIPQTVKKQCFNVIQHQISLLQKCVRLSLSRLFSSIPWWHPAGSFALGQLGNLRFCIKTISREPCVVTPEGLYMGIHKVDLTWLDYRKWSIKRLYLNKPCSRTSAVPLPKVIQ